MKPFRLLIALSVLFLLVSCAAPATLVSTHAPTLTLPGGGSPGVTPSPSQGVGQGCVTPSPSQGEGRGGVTPPPLQGEGREGVTPSPSQGEGWGGGTQPSATRAATLPPPLPTDSPRLPAEKWQQWPVVPAVTSRFVEIYRRGLAAGNNPHAFSKIGDCQCVNAAFFGIYDKPGQYQLPRGYERLQETIDWFRGSFDRSSQAVRGGFNVASVLSGLWADPQFCQPGETPLACEFRQQKPSIVLISMETGFEGRTAAVYEKYMRQIIQYAIDHGAAPILATKADNFEGDQSINLTTARLAVEYDLPLWNFWLAVQPLPDRGMDAERNDKFHISVEAWNVRSFTGLEALDALWRSVR